MKKVLYIVIPILIVSILIGCSFYVNTTTELTETQQELIDRLWNNKHNWEEITGYVSGNGECDHVSFGEFEGQLVFTAYHFGSGNTVSANTYYIYTNKIIQMDATKASQFSLGVFSGEEWSTTSTKEDLKQIYLNYMDSK